MCQFKSAIVLKEPRNKGGFQLLMSPWTDSHSDLIAIHKLRDDGRLRFARVEFSPTSMATADKPETYALEIDEDRTPDWFSDEMRDAVAEKMRTYIRSIIITEPVDRLIGGQFILADGAKIKTAKNCLIESMLCNSTVNVMLANSTVNSMWGKSKVNSMRDNSMVNSMWANSTVNSMRDKSMVNAMWDNSTVNSMWDNSMVNAMRDNSKVNAMRGNSMVNSMWGKSTVKEMRGNSKVKNDFRAKKK